MEINNFTPPYDGIYLIDKEQDWTSFDVVAKLRNAFHIKKVGHAGTLDPMATGLLIVLAGHATKQSDLLMHKDKEYYATMRLGIETDTQDIWGTVLSEKEVGVSEKEIIDALNEFRGEISQIPPMFSAIKIKGKKLYEIARKGKEIEREPRIVNIYNLDYLGRQDNDIRLRVVCSSGTYIRTLCYDIGRFLGCGACMAQLRRTKIGDFSVEDAVTIDNAIKLI